MHTATGFGLRSVGYIILDEDFEVLADEVRTVAPLTRTNNSHDFQILEDGNYLLMAYEPATRDFSDIDLPYLDGAAVSSVDVRDAAFQIVTPGGHAVFTWNSWGNMAIEDCVQHRFPVTLSTDPDMRSPEGGYAHINGMHVVDGVLVASMRGCSKVLGIDVGPGATRGDVLWRMGRTNLSDAEWAARDIGPRPLDFINDPEGEFCGQHTARFLPNGNVFLFDNGVVCVIDPWTFEQLGREGNDFSRAVEYALDLENHEAVFVRDHSLRGERSHLGYATGNVDVLDNGDWLVSWGRVLTGADRFPDNEMATLVDPATGQEKLGIRFRELPSNERDRRINATVAPAEALAPQPVPLTAEFPASVTPRCSTRAHRPATGRGRLQPARGGLQRRQPVAQRHRRDGRERQRSRCRWRAGQRLPRHADAGRRRCDQLPPRQRSGLRRRRHLHRRRHDALGSPGDARDRTARHCFVRTIRLPRTRGRDRLGRGAPQRCPPGHPRRDGPDPDRRRHCLGGGLRSRDRRDL